MNFEMIGKISMSKATDKFNPYEERTFDSGWVRRRLVFNAICGDNRHMLTVDAGSFKDGHGDIYTFSKNYKDASGNDVKGSTIQIPFKDRLTSPKIAEVAEFRKFVVDLEEQGRRYLLENAATKIKEGTSLTDEDLAAMGLTDESEVTDALEKSRKLRHEYISEWDFVEFIKKVIDSGKYKNKKFAIRGNVVKQYSDEKGRWYESIVPQRIYLAKDNAEEYSKGTLKMYFNKDALDEMSVEEKGKYYVNGFTLERNNPRKTNIPCPVTIVINTANKSEKLIERSIVKFKVDDDSWKEYGVEVNMLNGAQRTEITEDMLTDDQKEDLECGLITMDEIRRELGNDIYGERVQELQFIGPARGYSKGSMDTVYTDEDMIIKPLEDETDDLFDDDDEEI